MSTEEKNSTLITKSAERVLKSTEECMQILKSILKIAEEF
jgi:hypothetical protein